nr:acidic phospholipase A2 S12-65J-like isoform X2 [Anser cygnoides]
MWRGLSIFARCGDNRGGARLSGHVPAIRGAAERTLRCSTRRLAPLRSCSPPAMKLLVLLVCLAGLASVDGGVIQFARMIKVKTGKNALAYNGYGCYCGLGGTKQPLDATDRCCHAHDCCYSKLKSSSPGCHPTLVHYTFYLQGDEIVCGKRQREAKATLSSLEISAKKQPASVTRQQQSASRRTSGPTRKATAITQTFCARAHVPSARKASLEIRWKCSKLRFLLLQRDEIRHSSSPTAPKCHSEASP